jgi:pyridoxamine--pyruvate transaminase
MLTPGPVAVYPAVARAMSQPLLFDQSSEFGTFYEALTRKAAAAMRWHDPALLLHMEAAPGIEVAAASVIARDTVVLNLVSGVYGAGFSTWARRHAREVIELAVPFDQAIDPNAVRDALRARPEIGLVSAVHHETPGGTLNPLHAIGAEVHAHGALLMVDAVSSFAGMDVHPADIHADIFVASPGKCLGAAPGLTFMAVSPRAWAAIHANGDAPRGSVLSLADWEHAWRPDQPFPFTPSLAELFGLEAALDLYAQEGPENVWARHAATARACRAGAAALGLSLWAAVPEIVSPTATVLRVPPALNAAEIVRAMRERWGVQIADGRGATAGRVVRIGHMGPAAEPILAVAAIAALGDTLRRLGFGCDPGAGVAAALGG